MSWNLKCRKVRRLLALWSGNDLDEAGQLEAERHMASCPHCREEWLQLKAGRQVLESVCVAEAEAAPLTASVWPAVERQIRVLDQEAATANWRGWLPVGALAAACVSIVMVLPPGQFPQMAATQSNSRSIPVIFSPSGEGGNSHLEAIRPGDAWRSEGPGRRGASGLPEAPRVRTLLDGTDLRGL